MNDRELIANLDACRPGTDDLGQPELRGVAEIVANDARANEMRVRLLRVDSALIRTMHSAAIPDGLENRLIARLQQAGGEAALGDAVAADIPDAARAVLPARNNRPVSRRRWIAWSAGMAAAAASLITVFALRSPEELTSDDLLMADRWHEVLAESDDWLAVGADELQSHPLPNELRHWPSRYRDASRNIGRTAAAYDLSAAEGPRATLFVIEQPEGIDAPVAAPQQPQLRTHGYSVAYWQRGDSIYVVVIESDRPEDYHRLLRAGVPMAA